MSKHTPGPWVVNVDKEEGADWAYQWPTIEAADYQVVGTEGLYGDMDTDLANARLIAAAPDLLEACKRFCGVMNGLGFECDPTAEFGRAAISKATGEPQ